MSTIAHPTLVHAHDQAVAKIRDGLFVSSFPAASLATLVSVINGDPRELRKLGDETIRLVLELAQIGFMAAAIAASERDGNKTS